MATIGFKYVVWGKLDESGSTPAYSDTTVIGKAISANVTVNNAEAELYADDGLAEYASEFISADLTMDVDNIDLEKQALLYGSTFADGVLTSSSADNAPYGGLGAYQVLQVNGAKKYRAFVFPKLKASIPDFTANTKAESISFGTEPIKAKITALDNGQWRIIKEIDTEAEAKAYVDSQLNMGGTSVGG